MKENNTGGPAFPAHTIAMHEGMTLRDYFAAKAMQGLLAADIDCNWESKTLAIISYEQADAMLEARK